MKTRRFFSLLAVLVLITVFATGCHSRRFGSDYPQAMLEHIDDEVEDLQLTAEQDDQYQALRARLETDLLGQKATHDQFRQSMKALIEQETTGVKEITANLRTKIKDVPAMADLYMDYIDEFYDILDDQQKATVMDEVRKKSGRMWRD